MDINKSLISPLVAVLFFFIPLSFQFFTDKEDHLPTRFKLRCSFIYRSSQSIVILSPQLLSTYTIVQVQS